MAKGLTPSQTAAKQIKNAKNAVDAFKLGAQNVKEAPNAKAAKAAQKYLSNVQAAVDNGNYAAGNNSVTLADWQDAMINKGAKNYPTGIDYATQKIIDFHNAFDPYRDQVAASVNQMPDDTESERDAKMLANAQRLRQFNYRKRKP
jgi:hypothetical protein